MEEKIIQKTTKENIKLFKSVVQLAINIADKYEDDRAYEAALVGLFVGLNVYSEKNRAETDLDLYLSWFIQTSIEYELGIENEDTKIWDSKKEKA